MLKKGFGSPAGREKREDSKRERDREERRGKGEERREQREERRKKGDDRREKREVNVGRK